MALIECKECKRKISDKALCCPKCGCRDPFTNKSECPECKIIISNNSKVCPECGLPKPFQNSTKYTDEDYNLLHKKFIEEKLQLLNSTENSVLDKIYKIYKQNKNNIIHEISTILKNELEIEVLNKYSELTFKELLIIGKSYNNLNEIELYVYRELLDEILLFIDENNVYLTNNHNHNHNLDKYDNSMNDHKHVTDKFDDNTVLKVVNNKDNTSNHNLDKYNNSIDNHTHATNNFDDNAELKINNNKDNTSGHGISTNIPNEIKKWNWGAFFFTYIWGIFNKVYISFIWIFCIIPISNTDFNNLTTSRFMFLFIVPCIFGFVLSIVLGLKGSEWAWRNKRWKSIEHFKKVQNSWSKAAIGFFIFFLFILIIAIVLVILPSFINLESNPPQMAAKGCIAELQARGNLLYADSITSENKEAEVFWKEGLENDLLFGFQDENDYCYIKLNGKNSTIQVNKSIISFEYIEPEFGQNPHGPFFIIKDDSID